MTTSQRFIFLVLALAYAHPSRSSGQGDEATRRFMWDQANAQMGTARTEEDFLASAHAYQGLVTQGARNGALFYNLGTALLMAGEYDRAAAALRRAERYVGATPEIRRNLILAASRGRPESGAITPWYRMLLFWHFRLATSIRIGIAVVAFLACWGILTCRLVQPRARWKPLAAGALLVFILVSSSAATSLYNEWHADTPGHRALKEPPTSGSTRMPSPSI